MQFKKHLIDVIRQMEQSKLLTFKILLLIYLLSRLFMATAIYYKGASCAFPDCKQYWHNVEFVVAGFNPYIMWKNVGVYEVDIPLRADFPPFFYILLSPFAFLWRNVWSMRLVFFIADFLNLCLVYSLAKSKKIASLAYLSAPLILLSALVLPADEIFVTFVLASMYFLKSKRYDLSVLMLALSFNIKGFAIFLLPLLLLNIGILKTRGDRFLPEAVHLKGLLRLISIFVVTSVVCHSFYYPDWMVAYEFRDVYFSVASHQAIWQILPYYNYAITKTAVLVAFGLLYIFSYIKRFDIETNFLLGSLIFFTLYPGLTFEHLIFIVPLFLIWTEVNYKTVVFWIYFVAISAITTPLPLPFTAPYVYWLPLILTALLGFYYIIFDGISKRKLVAESYLRSL